MAAQKKATKVVKKMAGKSAKKIPKLESYVAHGSVKASERVVLFNTGAGGKYLEAFGLK